MTHPVDAFIPYVPVTAHRFGASLSPQDREEMEAHMRAELWRGWITWRPDGGSALRSWLFSHLRSAAMEWMRTHKPGRLTRHAHLTIQSTPPGSPDWERIPYHRRQDILGMVAVRRCASLDDLLSSEEDDGDPLRGGEALKAPTVPSPEEILLREEPGEAADLLASLPPREREALRLLYVDGLSRKEAAAQMGITVKSLGVCRDRAMMKVRAAARVPRQAMGYRAAVLSVMEERGISVRGSIGQALEREIAAASGYSVGTVRRVVGEERAMLKAEGR